jgi:hypothetical protein
MIPYANIRTALDRSAGRILMLSGEGRANRVQTVAVLGALWYKHS